MILECTHAVWDFSGLQPHVVSIYMSLFSLRLSHESFSLTVLSFAERW